MIQSKLLSQFPELVQAVTDKSDGNFAFRFEDKQKVIENRQRLFRKLDLDPEKTVAIKCQQSDDYEIATSEDAGSFYDPQSGLELDALITTDKNLTLTLTIADCRPIILYDPEHKVVAMVHVGRNGAEKKLLQKVAQALVDKYTTDVNKLVMFMGPGISANSYVFENVDTLDTKVWGSYISKRADGYHLNPKNFVLSQALQIGLRDENIEVSDIDTYSDLNYYSNYRSYHQGDSEGRIIAVVCLK